MDLHLREDGEGQLHFPQTNTYRKLFNHPISLI